MKYDWVAVWYSVKWFCRDTFFTLLVVCVLSGILCGAGYMLNKAVQASEQTRATKNDVEYIFSTCTGTNRGVDAQIAIAKELRAIRIELERHNNLLEQQQNK